ncbi:MAG: 16S rRNA (adenine(1518)-N(6)/adenine(1519)-N(6))-dimethyltransferase [Beggiatoa sp. IS2]|nr:MAG: 16S rRNA (adenine(1518)-N(6)/adenine(1519)-N(6))-dimethyltransferase [Beggiatoa sp. IS2]
MIPPYPRKQWGQHFLHDPTIIYHLITAIAPVSGQHLIEIGPGKGALTLPLLQQSVKLDVIELDPYLVKQLQPLTLSYPQLTVHHADALKFDFRTLVTDHQPVRIVGNLPYNISTPLLFHLLTSADLIQDMMFMLQKEVVDRMIAMPATANYGRLSVMLQYHCRIEKQFNVSPRAFYPPPQVDSTVVHLLPYFTPPVALRDFNVFSQVVTQAFSQRRKTLRNSLRGLLNETEIQQLGIDAQRRPETLTLTEFARLANHLV